MKNLCAVFLLVVMLAGCSSAKDYEGMSDVYAEQPLPSAAQMLVSLPPDAAVMTAEDGQTESIWLCDGYTVTVQTLASGDLSAPLQKVTGYEREQLAVMKLEKDGLPGENDTVFICHGDCIEDAEYLKARVQARMGVKEVFIGYTGAVIGSHSGPGTLALFFLGKNR